MCDTNLYLVHDDGQEERLMETVEQVGAEGTTVSAVNIYGQRCTFDGAFHSYSQDGGRITFRATD